MLYTVIALLVRILANPAANVLQKQLTARNRGTGGGVDPATVNLSTYILLSVVCVFPALSVDWGAMPRGFWLDCLLVGLFGGVGNTFLIKALQAGELSVLGPVNSWKSVIGMAVGVMVLGEIPGVWGLAGMALIVAGSYFVLLAPGERFTWSLLTRKDIRWRLYAMIFTAIEAVFIKRIIVLSSPAVSFIVWCWFGVVTAAAVAAVFARRGRLKTSFRSAVHSGNFGRCLAVAVCVGVAQYATNVVFAGMDVGYALALFQLSAIVSVLLGWRIFRESGITRKLLGAAIMIAGSAVIIILN